MPSVHNVLIVNDTRVDQHHGCTAVMTALERMLEEQGLTVAVRWPAHLDWRADSDFAHALERSHLIVVNGEGTIHHDRPAGRRLLELGRVARAAEIPVALVNTGWEANSPELTAMLSDFSLVTARDSASAAAMRVDASEVRVVPDLSLCTPSPADPPQRQHIGFTDNVVRKHALDLELLRRKIQGHPISIHHRQPKAAFLRAGLSLKQDLAAPLRIVHSLAARHVLWQASHDDLARFVGDLAGLTLLVSGRFHACTLALVAGTPFVAQASNTGKIASFVRDAGLETFRSTVPDDPAILLEIAAQGWSAHEDDARRAYLADARASAARLAVDLRALVS